jgi:hypothetical protein
MEMKIVLVDIDGTITKVGDRINHLNETPKDWDSFYKRCGEDLPVENIIRLVLKLSFTNPIVFCTGRRESCRTETVKWIKEHMGFSEGDYKLLMRADGDFRHDTKAKPELLEKAGIKLSHIEFVLEDRNSMVNKWRELGLTCLQVAEGDF